MGSSLTINDCNGGANSRRGYDGSRRDCSGWNCTWAIRPLLPPVHLTNTYQINICPHCGVMTFDLMDDDGNRFCGKCRRSKNV